MVLLLPSNVPVNGLVFVPMGVHSAKGVLGLVFNSPLFKTPLLMVMLFISLAFMLVLPLLFT